MKEFYLFYHNDEIGGPEGCLHMEFIANITEYEAAYWLLSPYDSINSRTTLTLVEA